MSRTSNHPTERDRPGFKTAEAVAAACGCYIPMADS